MNLKTLLAPAPVFGLMLILGFPPAPLLAQQELSAVLNQTNQLFGAGNYDAALIQAQKLEAGVKTRGANHPNYEIALNQPLRIYAALGRYANAESAATRARNPSEGARTG